MSDFIADLNGVVMDQTIGSVLAKNSTNTKAGNSNLDMSDFLQLMVATLQNQSIDNVTDTSDMMNQMMTMSVIQAVTNMNNLLSESTSLTYAASLVGKEVTVGQYVGNDLVEIRGTVTGTGTLDGKQVIFIGNDSYWLSDVMAVGRLPDGDLNPGEEEEDLAANFNTAALPNPALTEDEDGEDGENRIGRVGDGEAPQEETRENDADAAPIDDGQSAGGAQTEGEPPPDALEQAAEEIYENSI